MADSLAAFGMCTLFAIHTAWERKDSKGRQGRQDSDTVEWTVAVWGDRILATFQLFATKI